MSRLFALGLLLAVLGLGVGACSGDGPDVTIGPGDGGSTTQAPDTTKAPDTTQAPDTTKAPDTTQGPDTTQAPDTTEVPAGEGEAPWWILIVGGVLFVILIVVLARSGKKKNVTVANAAPSWKDLARRGYADSRWLFDHLTEALAIWRGNAQYDQKTDVGSTAETANAETWGQLANRMGTATDSLYGLEAGAPDTRTAQSARSVVDRLNDTRSAVDARAEARYAYRAAEGEAAGQPDRATRLSSLRDRELRSSENLTEARRRLAEALTNLSAVT